MGNRLAIAVLLYLLPLTELDKAKGKSQEEEDGCAGPSSTSTGATQFYDITQEDGGAGPSSAPVELTTGATKFYDPTRDAWKGS